MSARIARRSTVRRIHLHANSRGVVPGDDHPSEPFPPPPPSNPTPTPNASPAVERERLTSAYARLSKSTEELRRQYRKESRGIGGALLLILGTMIVGSGLAPALLAYETGNFLWLAVALGLLALGGVVVGLAVRSERSKRTRVLRALTPAGPSDPTAPVLAELLTSVETSLGQIKEIRTTLGWSFLLFTIVGITVADFLASTIFSILGAGGSFLSVIAGPIAVLVLLAPLAILEERKLDRGEAELKALAQEVAGLETAFFSAFSGGQVP